MSSDFKLQTKVQSKTSVFFQSSTVHVTLIRSLRKSHSRQSQNGSRYFDGKNLHALKRHCQSVIRSLKECYNLRFGRQIPSSTRTSNWGYRGQTDHSLLHRPSGKPWTKSILVIRTKTHRPGHQTKHGRYFPSDLGRNCETRTEYDQSEDWGRGTVLMSGC